MVCYILVGSAVSFMGCNRDPEIDLCIDAEPVTAKFDFVQVLGDSLVVIDTVLVNPNTFRRFATQTVTFLARDKYQSVKWKVGNDPREFTEEKFSLDFRYDALGEIPVKLSVSKIPNVRCFPNDDGLDSLSKSFVILPKLEWPFAFEGKFEGFHKDEPTKRFTIEIKDFGDTPPHAEGWYGIRLFNLPEGCGGEVFDVENFSPSVSSLTYKRFYLKQNATFLKYSCPEFEYLYGKVSSKGDSIHIKYKSGVSGQFLTKEFLGRRLGV